MHSEAAIILELGSTQEHSKSLSYPEYGVRSIKSSKRHGSFSAADKLKHVILKLTEIGIISLRCVRARDALERDKLQSTDCTSSEQSK